MKKSYIRMNVDDNQFSLGNMFRIIKECSKNKTSALQSELFCILFDLDNINETTVNNYCVGCRGIGSEYKQIYLNKQKKYEKDRNCLVKNVFGIVEIMDGRVYTEETREFLDNNVSLLLLCRKLYNLAKNDRSVSEEFTTNLNELVKDNKLYEAIVNMLFYIVLEKKQPVYEEELKREVIETILSDTSISSVDLQEYLSLKLREGINYDYSMKELASRGNAYANFELGCNEYYGYVVGYNRYDIAYGYLKKAALVNHATANYMLANMLIKGLVGSCRREELSKGYEYLKRAWELGNIAALNLLGQMSEKGIYPVEKNLNLAITYYNEAASNHYAFAYNNLGHLEEDKGNLEVAFDYYKKAADLGESWACNKVGEMYRLGLVKRDMEKAFYYYNRALDVNYRILCFYAYYNLAKYFYSVGYGEGGILKDFDKSVKYYEIAHQHGVMEASIELFKIKTEKYLKTREEKDYEEVLEYKRKIESNRKYNRSVAKEIESIWEDLCNKESIILKGGIC